MRLGRLLIYGAGVLSDTLAELGANAIKLIPVLLRRFGFILANITGLVVLERYGALAAIITVAIAISGVLVFFITRRRRRRTVLEHRISAWETPTRYSTSVKSTYSQPATIKVKSIIVGEQ